MKSINRTAPVTCSRTITIRASPEKVWLLLTGINQWASWQTAISKPQLNGPLQPGTTFSWKTGGAGIRSTLHTVAPYKQFGWTGKTFGMFAIHNWTLSATGGEVVVHVEESMEGFLAKLFRRSFSKSLEKGMEAWLDMLKNSAEHL